MLISPAYKMSSPTRRVVEDPPLSISSDSSDASSNESDLEARLKERACDREDAQSAYELAIEKAEANLEKFKKQAQKEAELDRITRALKRRRKELKKKGKDARKGIEGSSENAANPPVKHKKKADDPLNRDQLYAVAANKVAKHVLEVMVQDGVTDGPVAATLHALEHDDPPPVHEISHEEQLLVACVPEQLRTVGFEGVNLKFPSVEPLLAAADGGPQAEIIKLIKATYDGLAAINTKVDHLIRNQQIHTIAHLANIRATGFLRLFCLKDGAKQDRVHENLLISMKSVILGSDPELRDLPFRSLAQTEVFFRDINHIVKLGHFLLAFVEYDRFYPAKLMDTVFHIELQRSIYWKSGVGNNGWVSDAIVEFNLQQLNIAPISLFRVLPADARRLPRYVELFLQRVAIAAYGLANDENAAVFDMEKFNKDVRKHLYNTERNESRRRAAENRTACTKAPTPIVGVSDTDDDGEIKEDDEFFNFKRSKKVKDETAGEPGKEQQASDEKPPATPWKNKRPASPGNPPVAKKSMTMPRASVLDHVKSVVEDGMPVDSIIQLMRSYVRALSHRKGLIRASKDLSLFIKDLEENDGENDILEMAETYHIALSKLPAILE